MIFRSPSQGHVLRILDVELCVLVHLSVAARRDLPEPGQAGLDRCRACCHGSYAVDDAFQLGTGTDEAQRSP